LQTTRKAECSIQGGRPEPEKIYPLHYVLFSRSFAAVAVHSAVDIALY